MLSVHKGFIVSLCVLLSVTAGFAQIQVEPETAPVTQPLDDKVTDEADGLTLLARFDKASYKPVEPITLTAIFRNNSTTNASYYSENRYDMFGFRVTTSNGKNVPLTDYGKRATSGPHPSRSTLWLTLKPGEEWSYTFVLNRLYDMSIDGEYKISVLGNVMTRGNIVEWDKNMPMEEIMKTIKRSRFVSKAATITVNPH